MPTFAIPTEKPVKMTKFDEVANLTKSDRHEFTMFAVSLCNSYAAYCISFDGIYKKTVFLSEFLRQTPRQYVEFRHLVDFAHVYYQVDGDYNDPSFATISTLPAFA